MKKSTLPPTLLRISSGSTRYSGSTRDGRLSLAAVAALVLLCGILVSRAPAIVFTGDAETDFATSTTAVVIPDSPNVGLPPLPDVGLPPDFPDGSISGWDMKTAYFDYDPATDTLFVGLDFFTIAGDADDDGDPGATSPELDDRGGEDLPNLAATETILIVFDLDQDGAADIGAGVPSSFGSLLDPSCPDYDIDDCFGLFDVGPSSTGSPPFVPLARRSETATLFASPSGAEPDFELSIPNWSSILPADVCGPWSVDVNIFAGAFLDDGIGEDSIPNGGPFASLDFPGTAFEVCRSLRTAVIAGTEDVTLGQGTTIKGTVFLEALGVDLIIGRDSMMINSSSLSGLSADRIVIGSNGSFHGAFAYNQLTLGSNTTLTGPETTPAPLPVLTLPAFQPATPGTQTKVVGSGQTLNLPAGDYGFLIANGTVILDGNLYNFQQIILGSGARIEATMPVDIRVAQNIQAGQSIFIGPAPGAPDLSARDIMIDVGGYLATSQWATVHANIHAQEKIVFGESTKAVGAFFTKVFVGGKFSEFMLDSAYAPFCGDGNVDPGEQCDDGNNLDGDGCSAECVLDTGDECPFSPCFLCGDAVVTPPEECDDGNDDDGDGCSAECTTEMICNGGLFSGFMCTPDVECPGGSCIEFFECVGAEIPGNDIDDNCNGFIDDICGDGDLAVNEECDDGNLVDGDGCSTECGIEPGYTCEGAPSVCSMVGSCSDGTPCQNNGDCDGIGEGICTICLDAEIPGNGVDDDCDGLIDECVDVDGDGVCSNVDIDDMNELVCSDIDADNCDDCSVTGGQTPENDGPDSDGDGVCDLACGDGVVQGAEQCDDNNTADGDGCNASCMHEVCGDGVVQTTLSEQCDDGNLVSGDGCSSTCLLEPN